MTGASLSPVVCARIREYTAPFIRRKQCTPRCTVKMKYCELHSTVPRDTGNLVKVCRYVGMSCFGLHFGPAAKPSQATIGIIGRATHTVPTG